MPQVPYVPYPTAEPTTQGTPTLRIETPSAAFGENIGKAVEGFGQGLEHDSQLIWQRAVAMQELQNETDARNADIQASTQMGKLHADFSAKEGVNAGPAALEKYSSDLNEVYQRVRGTLTNPDAQRRYDATAVSVLNRSIFNGAGHSAEQMKQAAVKSAQAQVQTDADDLYHNPTEQGLDDYLDKARRSAHTVAGAQGLDPVATQELENKYTSHELSHLITGLAKQSPWKAGELLEKYRDSIHGQDIERVENSIQQAQRTAGARNISMQVNSDLNNPDMEDHRGLNDRIQDGREMAAKLAPKDELLPAYVDQHITADYNRWKQVNRDTEFTNKQTIEGALMGNFSNGKIPMTVDELRANPQVDAAWSSLKPSDQRHYLNTMSEMVRRGERVDPYTSLQARQKYVGMAQNDPNAFLETDILADRNLSVTDMKYLSGLKNQVYKQGGADPKLSHAMQVLRPDLDNAGITRTADPSTLDRFTGVMHDWMTDYINEHKKAPKDQEVLEAGRRLLQQIPGAHWWSGSTRPIEDTPSQEEMDTIRADIKSRDPTYNPSDEEIIRAVAKGRLKRAFDQPKPSGDKAGQHWNPDTMKWEEGAAEAK
jgi:hypothetical protein